MCYNFVNGLRLKLLFVFIRDIRTIHPDVDRIYSFSKRSENYFQLFKSSAGTTSLSTLPYLHYLRNHTGDLMTLHFSLFGWGYGMFCCNAGEHLNKRIKVFEVSETNMDQNRFVTVVKLIRMKQFVFTDSIMQNKVTVTCSACKQHGHNRKNKSCPLHPSHPTIEFDSILITEQL